MVNGVIKIGLSTLLRCAFRSFDEVISWNYCTRYLIIPENYKKLLGYDIIMLYIHILSLNVGLLNKIFDQHLH